MKKGYIILISSIVVLVSIGGFYLYRRKTDFKRKIVHIAKEQLAKWQGVKELSNKMSQTLVSYWKSVGMHFSTSQMQSSSVHNTYPWSSAFISYLFFKAGAKEHFPYSSAHSGYFQVAKRNRDNPNAPLRGFRIDEYSPKVGDLIVFSRQAGAGYDTSGFFPSHGELVVEVGKGFVKTIGGNVADAVSESRFTTDQNGYITKRERNFFMVIQNRIK